MNVKAPVTLFRVAHKSSIYEGLYRSRYTPYSFNFNHNPSRHPMPNADRLLVNYYEDSMGCDVASCDLFGFADRSQVLSWIYREEFVLELESSGYLVYELTLRPEAVEGVNYMRGATQAMFDKRLADVTEIHQIKDFF